MMASLEAVSAQKPLNVDVNHVVFVQMLLEVGRLADFQSGEHCFRVAALAVIRRQHIGSDGLPEPSRTAVADITLQCI